MTEIVLPEKDKELKYGIGDWVLVEDTLYVIAQVDSGLITCIAISEKDANRNASPIEYGEYRDLSRSILYHLFQDHKFRKVDIKIEVIKVYG